MRIFLPYTNLYSKMSGKFYQQFTKTKLKSVEKKQVPSGFNYKER